MILDKELVEEIDRLQQVIDKKIKHSKQMIKFIDTVNIKLKEFGKKWNIDIKEIGKNIKESNLEEIKQLKKL